MYQKKHITFAVLAITLLSFQLRPNTPVTQSSITNNNVTEKTSWGPVSSRIVFGSFILTVCFASGNNYVKQKITEQLQPKNLLCNMAKEYSTTLITNLAHEGGHALAAKAINNDKISIALGANSTNKTSFPIFKSDNLTIYGLDPFSAHCTFNYPVTESGQLDKLSYGTILCAGPLAGFLTSILLNQIIHYTSEKEFLHELDCLTHHLSIEQLFNLFLPFTIGTLGKSDAYKLYRLCLDFDPQIIQKISSLDPIVRSIYEVWSTMKNTDDIAQAPVHSIILIALANNLLRGFAHFHL